MRGSSAASALSAEVRKEDGHLLRTSRTRTPPSDAAPHLRCYAGGMSKTPTRATRRRAASRRQNRPTAATLRAIVRPIVRELMAKELERLEDRLDAQDAAEALREPGEIPHEEFWKKHGL